jgi:hypothetical protein
LAGKKFRRENLLQKNKDGAESRAYLPRIESQIFVQLMPNNFEVEFCWSACRVDGAMPASKMSTSNVLSKTRKLTF